MTSTDPGQDEGQQDSTGQDTADPGQDEGQQDSTGQDTADPGQDEGQQDDDPGEGDLFPRVYVERLRSKSAQYRTAANEARQQADDYRQQLWAARVEAAGRLADPTDLPAPDDADPDPDTVQAAIDDLLERKPHLAARRARGDIGQHQQRSSPDGEVSLMGILQRGA